jgi:hypothetical protein
MILAERNNVPGQFQSSNHTCMELRPKYKWLFIILKIERDFNIIGHDPIEIDFGDFNNISDKGSAGCQIEGSLSYDNCEFSISELNKDVLAFDLPFLLRNRLDVLDFYFYLRRWT